MNNITKKNEFATFLVYVAMFAIALVVGLVPVRNAISASDMNSGESVAVVIISVLAGILANSLGLELLHLLGAKAGGYQVNSWIVLGAGFKRNAKGKMRWSFSAFQGLTGQTDVLPKNRDTASPSGMVIFPMLGYLIEVIVLLILSNTLSSVQWLPVFSYVVLAVGGMIFVYNDFPAHLDSFTDGYLLTLLTKPVNRLAYNDILLAFDANKGDEEKAMASLPIYEDLSDFTSSLNVSAAYRLILEGKNEEALAIFEAISSCPKGISATTRQDATCQALALLLLGEDNAKSQEFYDNVSDADRKFIATITTLPSLRCYALISAVMENSESETDWAFDKAEKLKKKAEGEELKAEKALLAKSYDKVMKLHPEWDIQSDFLHDEEEENPTEGK